MIKNKLYIGGDFLDSQLLWIIPLADSFCRNNKIDTIFFQKKISNQILKNKIIVNILKNYEVKYLSNEPGNSFIRKLFYLRFLPKAIIKTIFFKKENLLNSEFSWYKIQKLHAIWDQARRLSKDKELKPTFLSILISCIIQSKFENLALKALKKKINYYFLGHIVYGHRSFLAEVNKIENSIFVHKNTSMYKQNLKLDNSWNFINKIEFKRMINKVSPKKIDNYFKLRSIGKGRYLESKIAAQIKNKNTIKFRNVIFLHIFRDSPFTYIDKKRIFIDYYDWVFFTLNVIKDSKEKWLIKYHPSYSRWGEDQKLIVNLIVKKLKLTKSKNLYFDDRNISNTNVYANAKRIITFSGTSHIEAVTNKIKPIVISETMLSNFNHKMVIKPSSLQRYKKLLNLNHNDNIFRVKPKEVMLAKKLIYLRENALKIDREVGSFHVFSKDKKKIIKQDFNQVKKKLKKNLVFLNRAGKFLSKKNYLVSKNFL